MGGTIGEMDPLYRGTTSPAEFTLATIYGKFVFKVTTLTIDVDVEMIKRGAARLECLLHDRTNR